VAGRAVILASGGGLAAAGVPGLEAWSGAGAFYGAAGSEA
jgi:hypothetical protein